MASPFLTAEAFHHAIAGSTQGAIYTFAHTPAVNGTALAVAALLFIHFVTHLLTPKHPKASRFDRSLMHLSLLLVTGLLSLVRTTGKERRGYLRWQPDLKRISSCLGSVKQFATRHIRRSPLPGDRP